MRRVERRDRNCEPFCGLGCAIIRNCKRKKKQQEEEEEEDEERRLQSFALWHVHLDKLPVEGLIE